LKIATREDIPEIVRMSMDFVKVSGYEQFADEETIANLAYDFVQAAPNEKIILIKSGVGFIAGISTPFLFGKCNLASEIAWWVDPEVRGSGEGIRLLEAFEYWAKFIAECKLISMASLNKDVEKYYKKSGYKLYERAYLKVL
jgi:hypothetical protein